MTKYADTIVTSKLGTNHVRSVVEAAKCIFHKIEQENDLGIDGLIEFTKDGVPQNKQIAIQIKSGQSYYNSQTNQCLIPVGNHFDYWTKHSLSVCGIVYIPSLNSASWVNIKNYLKQYGQCSTIRFVRSRTNIFDHTDFTKIFVPTIFKELPDLSFEEAASFFHSKNPAENYLGLVSLFRKFPNNLEVWDWFIEFFRSKDVSDIPPSLIYYFAHIPWHGGIGYRGEKFNDETKAHAKKHFEDFSRADVIKLLAFIDEENMISRGSIGQSVEAIVSSLSKRDVLLIEIINDKAITMFIRECAALIFGYHKQKDSIPLLLMLSDQGSWYAGELALFMKENGWIDPYV
jgi:hypothetical protein